MSAFVVLGLIFSIPSQEIGLGEMSPEWPILCRVWRNTTTQSISQSEEFILPDDLPGCGIDDPHLAFTVPAADMTCTPSVWRSPLLSVFFLRRFFNEFMDRESISSCDKLFITLRKELQTCIAQAIPAAIPAHLWHLWFLCAAYKCTYLLTYFRQFSSLENAVFLYSPCVASPARKPTREA